MKMSILNFFKSRDGLPDKKGSLFAVISSKAIALVNKEMSGDNFISSNLPILLQ